MKCATWLCHFPVLLSVVVIGFNAVRYSVDEDEGTVEVCVSVRSRTLFQDDMVVEVEYETAAGSAERECQICYPSCCLYTLSLPLPLYPSSPLPLCLPLSPPLSLSLSPPLSPSPPLPLSLYPSLPLLHPLHCHTQLVMTICQMLEF